MVSIALWCLLNSVPGTTITSTLPPTRSGTYNRAWRWVACRSVWSRDLEGRVRVAPGPITVEEFFARFPEVPRDLRDEPVLAEFVRAFGSQLRVAQKPSPCVAQAGSGDAEHHFYMRLVNDLAIYGIGLARRERTLQRLEALLVEYRTQPATFACTLVPRKGPDAPRAECR